MNRHPYTIRAIFNSDVASAGPDPTTTFGQFVETGLVALATLAATAVEFYVIVSTI